MQFLPLLQWNASTQEYLIIAGIVFFGLGILFVNYRKSGKRKMKSKQLSEKQLAAFERMMIFLDRIEVAKLAQRVAPISGQVKDYANFLIQHINQEFEFNSSMQLYIPKDLWTTIVAAKNASIQTILKTSLECADRDAYFLQQKLVSTSERQTLSTSTKKKLSEYIQKVL